MAKPMICLRGGRARVRDGLLRAFCAAWAWEDSEDSELSEFSEEREFRVLRGLRAFIPIPPIA